LSDANSETSPLLIDIHIRVAPQIVIPFI